MSFARTVASAEKKKKKKIFSNEALKTTVKYGNQLNRYFFI